MNAKSKNGKTALHHGCENGHANVIQTFVDLGCDLNGDMELPLVQTALADNAARRAGAQAALEDIAFEDFAEIHELLDFLFLSQI